MKVSVSSPLAGEMALRKVWVINILLPAATLHSRKLWLEFWVIFMFWKMCSRILSERGLNLSHRAIRRYIIINDFVDWRLCSIMSSVGQKPCLCYSLPLLTSILSREQMFITVCWVIGWVNEWLLYIVVMVLLVSAFFPWEFKIILLTSP